MMKEYFTEQGDIEIIGTAYDGRECLNMLENIEPDVLILDLIMPHIDGLAVLKSIRESERKKHPNIIMLTAFGQEEVMKRAVDYGASYFILKPFDFANLVSKVREVHGYQGASRTVQNVKVVQ